MLAPNVKIIVLLGVMIGGAIIVGTSDARLPGNDQGYAPVQPIAYSHRLHASELGIDCRYCHYGAETSPSAGIPPTSVCMTCHTSVTASGDTLRAEKARADAAGEKPRRVFSSEIEKLYEYLGLDENAKPKPGATPKPIPWIRVHDLPDYVYFDHRPHVGRMECQACHGPVETMERVRQETSLSMGWCVECHRINVPGTGGVLLPGQEHPRADHHVSTDCSVCHY
ncbi:MAG: hypothetical protein CMJ83_07185 [Planctomycetes bacterium]|nr:hypothetical protein [Planctomycetota bacterium]